MRWAVLSILAFFVLAYIVGSHDTLQQAASPAATAEPTGTPAPDSGLTAAAVVAEAARIGTSAARRAHHPPSVPPTPVPTIPPTATPIPPRVQTAQAKAAIRAERKQATAAAVSADSATQEALAPLQDDFRAFAGQLLGIQHYCSDPGSAAMSAFQAVASGSGNAVDTYSAAQSAQDACDAAKEAFLTLTVPGSLSGFKLDDARYEMYDWAKNMGNALNDEKKILENNYDVAAAADIKKMTQAIQEENMMASAPLAEASIVLKVPIAEITPTLPQQ